MKSEQPTKTFLWSTHMKILPLVILIEILERKMYVPRGRASYTMIVSL